MSRVVNIVQVWMHELCEASKDEGILIFILFVPLFYPLLYSYVYTNEMVREVPVAVVDANCSPSSREFTNKVDACSDVLVSATCANISEAKELLYKRSVYGIIYIPESFSKDISRGDQTTIGLYCDMGSMLYYKALLLSANNVAMEMNRNIKVEKHLNGFTDRQDEIEKMPVEYEYVPLYNTQSGFAAFLIPPVLMLIIQQTLCLGVGMSMGRGRENYRRNVKLLSIIYTDAPSIVIGKSLFYFMLYMVSGCYMFGIITPSFGLPNIGDYATFLYFLVPYLLSCTFFAITLSTLVYRREDCIMLFVSMSVPLLFLSGITWPREAMPEFWKGMSYVFPSTYGIRGYVKIASMGAKMNEVLPEYMALWIQTIVYFVSSCLLYRWRISLVREKLGGYK